jgi:hypothetical protein
MPYRPQFDFCDTPEGYRDEDFEYVFTPDTTPALGTVLLSGQVLLGIPLQLQTDAPEYLIRQIQIGTPSEALSVRFRDAFENYISESGPGEFIPSWAYASTQGNNGAIVEPEMVCPRGATILLDMANVG